MNKKKMMLLGGLGAVVVMLAVISIGTQRNQQINGPTIESERSQIATPVSEVSETASVAEISIDAVEGAVEEVKVDPEKKRGNRLINEKSPYLLQHAYNPVDWYPWGPEAFAASKREDKPIFLSVGYSTCYWCHVMEKESFENPEVAKLMNDTVIAIKVDREERPDIDAIYMAAVQRMTGRGGWPMTVFLTSEQKPFWGGTYFPPEDRGGRPGLKSILRETDKSWRTRRDEIVESSQTLTNAIQASVQGGYSTQLTVAVINESAKQFASQYDSNYGGFGRSPKFPRSHSLSFLLRAWHRSKDSNTLEMVEATLDAMHRGGMYDHLGGGFHRYSTDPKWLVPHFEKMLYDQAILARTYLEAYQITGNSKYADIARDIFEYVLRDMRSSQGAFYSAEDAGEVGAEGEFYVWTTHEIERILGNDEAKFFNQFYGVTARGNFEQGRSILHIDTPLAKFAKQQGMSLDDIEKRLEAARVKLLTVRNKRQRPHLDDKTLTDWNGLMIGSLSFGAQVLDEPRYAHAAIEAASFMLEHLQQDGRLLHRYREGEAVIPAFLDDYAYLSWGLMSLYEATFDARWLSESKRLTNEMVRLFWDEKSGGFFFSGDRNEHLIAQTKKLYDGALPSGNSVAALNLVRLGQLTMDDELQDYADKQFQAFSGIVGRGSSAFPQFLIALDIWLGPSQEIVIAGDPESSDTQEMIRALYDHFLPRAVMALHPENETASSIEALIPFIKSQRPMKNQATAYVCENYICNLPTTDVEKMVTLLNETR